MLRGLILALSLLAPSVAGAVTLGTFTNDYDTFTDTTGADAGTFDIVGSVPFSGDPVFTDSFDISSLAGETITELVLTITYGGTFSFLPAGSAWFLDAYGSDGSSQLDDISVALTQEPAGGLTTVTLTASDTTDVFANALSTLQVDFGFREESGGFDLFRIYDAVLTVNGTGTVPLPAPIFMLLLALGGLAVQRRRAAPVRVSAQA